MRSLCSEPLVLVHTPHSPVLRSLNRLLLIPTSVEQCGALIKSEDDVCPNVMLHLHRNLRGESMHRSIKMGLERDAVIVDVCQSVFTLCDNVIGLNCRRIHGDDLLESDAEG